MKPLIYPWGNAWLIPEWILTLWQYLWKCWCQAPIKQFLANNCHQQRYGTTINECHHRDTILLPPIESHQASALKQQVLASDHFKLLSHTIAICKTIGNCPTHNILKVLFYSGSTKTMIHHSSLPTKVQCIMDLPTLCFQTLGGKTTSTKAAQLSNISSLSSIATSPLIYSSPTCLTRTANMM